MVKKENVIIYGVKYRCYPTKEQKDYINGMFGARNFFWNKILEKYNFYYKQNQEIKKYNETATEKKELIQYAPLCGSFPNMKLYNIESIMEDGLNALDKDGNPSPKDFSWLKLYPKGIFNDVVKDFGLAWEKYYKYVSSVKSGKQQMLKVGRPSKKRKSDDCSVDLRNTGTLVDGKNVIDWRRGLIKTPGFNKIGYLKCVLDRRFEGKIKYTTISKDIDGKYYVALTIEEEGSFPSPSNDITKENVVAIDFGLKTFATIDNATDTANPIKIKQSVEDKILALEEKKEQLQKKQTKCLVTLSRKDCESYSIEVTEMNKREQENRNAFKGWHKEMSSGWKKYQERINKIQVKINNIKEHFIGNFASSLVKNDEVNAICVETLSIRDMTTRNKTKEKEGKKPSKQVKFRRAMARKLSRYAVGGVMKQLEYDCKKNGKHFVKAPSDYASTKICSCCGYKLDVIELKTRQWYCPNCGVKHDRDGNAAKNLAKYAFSTLTSTKIKYDEEDAEAIAVSV